ncbi:MAG TPA: CBS domain-containing protein [Methanomicrobia archaeon]|nr:CBS domain-containing protein [Methanomicrobia archaeon]
MKTNQNERGRLAVRDIMVTDVAYVTVPGTREDVLALFKEKFVSGVLVVKDGKVVGVVTRQDLLRKPNEEQVALLMTRDPVVITPDTSLAGAAKLIQSRGIRRLPVVEGHKLVGLVTVADFIREIATWNDRTPIAGFIREKTLALWDEMPLNVAGRIMELAKVKAVPVFNAELAIVGLITDQDLISAAMIEDHVHHSDLSLGSDESEWSLDGMRDTMTLYYSVSRIRLPKKLVREVMVRDVVTATRNYGVSACAQKMAQGRFDQLPVISARGKLIGMLLDRDLLHILS